MKKLLVFLGIIMVSGIAWGDMPRQQVILYNGSAGTTFNVTVDSTTAVEIVNSSEYVYGLYNWDFINHGENDVYESWYSSFSVSGADCCLYKKGEGYNNAGMNGRRVFLKTLTGTVRVDGHKWYGTRGNQ